MAVFPIKIQGGLGVSEKTIYKAPLNRTAKITSISYANTANIAYSIALYRNANGEKSLYYAFDLDAGDVVLDQFTHDLDPTDTLSATSSIGTVNFIIDGEETGT